MAQASQALATEPRHNGGKDAVSNATKPADSVHAADRSEAARWEPVLGLPCQFAVELPLPDLKFSDFLDLRVGSVLATGWSMTRDVPLRINGRLIAWGEFEVLGNRLAVRLTELA